MRQDHGIALVFELGHPLGKASQGRWVDGLVCSERSLVAPHLIVMLVRSHDRMRRLLHASPSPRVHVRCTLLRGEYVTMPIY